ncbi:MFS transporter [Gluconacetobacter azotocaptans]|uniref:MFS transporter n=1 Tax=Gluconacetobacter azotocaptans TaxID=142834 RepID=UPI00195766FD|nr:MFS transporter [Gluconacetobacter azotocaptans]
MPWIVLFALIAPINLLMSLDRQAMTLSAPVIQHEFGFSTIQMSAIIACVLWTYAFFQIPSGTIVNTLGPRRTLFGACFFWSFMTIITPGAGGFLSFLALRMAMGVGQAPDWSSSIVSIRNWFSPEKRGRANSVLLGFLYMGSVIGGPLTTHITKQWNWRSNFYIYGVIGLVLSILWLVFFRDTPPRGDGGGIDTAREDATAKVETAHLRRALRSWQFWSLGLHYMCLLTVQSFFLVNMPFYLMGARHVSYLSMGWLYGMPWLVLYLAVVAGGMISDTIQRKTRSVWLARTPMGVFGTGLCGLLVEIGCLAPSTNISIFLFCLALGLTGLSQISIWSSVQELTRRHTGLVAGWTTFLGNTASGLAPIAMTYIQGRTGSWPLAALVLTFAGIVGALCCLGTHSERPLHLEE